MTLASEVLDSRSFSALLSDANAPSRDYVYADFDNRSVAGWAVRDEHYI